MDLINIETNRIVRSAHTPDFPFPWTDIRTVDFSAIGINDVSSVKGKATLQRVARGSYVIENLVARWKTEDELFDIKAAKAEKMRQLQIRVIEIVKNRVVTQVDEPWRGLLEEISGDQVAVLGVLMGLCHNLRKTISTNDFKTAYVDLKGQIEAAVSKAELDAIVIP